MIEPKLRFKADDGSQFPDWEEKRLEEIVGKISSGKDKACNGNYVLYGSTGIIGTCQSPTYKGRKILVARVGANAGTVNLVNDDCGVSDNTLIINNVDLCNFDWLYFYMVHKELGKMRFGSGQPLITGTMLRDLCIQLPNDFEQQKIAEFLSTIDTVIAKQKETVSAWEERKKGVMQKLFSQEVRFKADDGSNFPEWEEKKLNEIAVRVTRKNKDNVTDIPLTISSADGLIDQRNFFNKVVASKDMSGYFSLKNGEFAYNKSYSKGYNFGSIKRLDLYDEGALSTLYICFALNKNENSDFYQKYFDSLSWYPELQKICAEGARNHGLLNVPTNDFFQLKLCVPSSDKEQHKIADCLSSLDEVIEKQKETLVAWEELKKGLLQQMFV